MSDAELRDREQAALRGEPGAVDAFVTALRRTGEDDRAWWVMVADVSARAADAEKILGSLARGDPYDSEAHVRGLEKVARAIDLERELRSLDGRTHVQWLKGQRVRIVRGAPVAKPPKGVDQEEKPVPMGTEGEVFWIARPGQRHRRGRGMSPPEPLLRGEVAGVGGGWQIGLRLPDAGWVVFTTEHNLERVPAHAWATLDARAKEATLATQGKLPERGTKVRARRRAPADGLVEVVIGRVCWAGVTKRDGVARVGIERSTKPTVWVDLLDDEGELAVEVLAPPPPARCIRGRARR